MQHTNEFESIQVIKSKCKRGRQSKVDKSLTEWNVEKMFFFSRERKKEEEGKSQKVRCCGVNKKV